MTVTIKQHKTDDYYVTLEIENRYGNNIYVVQVCPCYKNSDLCGYPIRENSYSSTEKQKALATYRRYIKRYCS